MRLSGGTQYLLIVKDSVVAVAFVWANCLELCFCLCLSEFELAQWQFKRLALKAIIFLELKAILF